AVGPRSEQRARSHRGGVRRRRQHVRAPLATPAVRADRRAPGAGAHLPYVGTSAGSNVAGPNILTTNDWNVVGLTASEAVGLVAFTVTPHSLESAPAMALGSETRDMRIAEYHVVQDNPVVGIEEGAMVRIEDGITAVRGTARAKLFRRGQPPA